MRLAVVSSLWLGAPEVLLLAVGPLVVGLYAATSVRGHLISDISGWALLQFSRTLNAVAIDYLATR